MKYFEIPSVCPVCGSRTEVVCKMTSEVLICANPECQGSLLNRLEHFCGGKGLDIKGLSKMTLSKLIEWGWVREPADLYTVHQWVSEWLKKPGFGKTSIEKILSAIEASREPKLADFISALGIPSIGKSLSCELAKHFNSYAEFREAAKSQYDFTHIVGIAYEKASAIWNFDFAEADRVADYMLGYKSEEVETLDSLAGEVICITGRVSHFANREELAKWIQGRGGKVASSVSKNTTWLITNDVNSNTVKNVAAQRLGIPIVTEEEFVNLYG